MDIDIPKITCTPKMKFVDQDTQKLRAKTRHTDILYCSCDLELDPMTLIYELNTDILKMCLIPKMNFLGQGFQMNKTDTVRQTDRYDRMYYRATFAGGS